MKKGDCKRRFNQAVQLEKNGFYAEAFNEYISIVDEDSGFRPAYINLGSLLSRMNRLADAMKCYRTALKLGQDYLTFFNIGSIYYKMGNYRQAVISMEKSCRINSSFTLARLVIGLCYSRLGNIAAAEKNFQTVLIAWPSNRVALTALAIIHFNLDRFAESLDLLNRILSSDSGNVKIKELKSTVLFKMGQIDESASEIKSITKISDGYKYFDEFIKSVPVETYSDRYGTLDEKIELLKEKIETDDKSLISLSLCHLFKGETEAAIDCLFEAKKRKSG